MATFEEKLANPEDINGALGNAVDSESSPLLVLTRMFINASDDDLISIVRIILTECGYRIAGTENVSVEGNMSGIERAVKAIAKSLEGMY